MAAVEKEVYVPDIGDFKDIEVIEVLVKPGDQIRPDDSLITLESDKAAMEVPSPIAGIVKSIRLKPGDRVSKGSLILVADETGKATVPPPAPPAKAESPAPVEPPVTASAPATPAPAPSQSAVSQQKSEQEVCVPDIGDYKDIEIIEVLVKPGDIIKADDSLITLESDKAAMEVPAPQGGLVKAVRVKPGDRVSKGTPILTLEIAGAEQPSQPAAAQSPAVAPAPGSVAESVKTAEPARPAAPVSVQTDSTSDYAYPPHASPAVRKFARELGVSLERIKASGPKGRVTREDVQGFVKQSMQQLDSQAAIPASPFAIGATPDIDFSRYGTVEMLALTRIQKLSGPNLHRNWVSIPHITQHDEADITDLESFRVSLKAEAEKRGTKLSLLPFVLKALVASLKAFPAFNASLRADGQTLVLKKYFHIGVAVDTPEGLVVPVIRDVDQKSIFDLAAELADLGQRARSKKLRGADLEGGCMTISSLGGIGGTAFTPIINAPEVAILGLSKSQTKPIYLNGQFEPRLMLPLSLSYDHRVIDGAQAARFIVHLNATLTDLRRILL